MLTPAEAALWDRVARTAQPMRPEARRPAEAAAAPPAAAPPKPRIRPKAPRPAPPAADPFEALAAAPSRLDGRRADRLRRGKLEPEARLDLHGFSRERAHPALVDFVLGAQARGLRLVLVITGKGRPGLPDAAGPERPGILRHAVPHWLAAPPLTGRVVEARPAHRRHGGAGALYLYLRRRPA